MDLNLHSLYFGTLTARLALAGDLHRRFGPALLSQPAIAAFLPVINELGREMQQRMREAGLPQRCSACGSRPEGGCCSREMAGEADAIQLLMNLLLAVPVRFRPEEERECGFLGPQGCTLRVKPIFCLNYNCEGIRTGVAAGQFKLLEQATGRLLTAQTRLEQKILDELQQLVLPPGGESPADRLSTGSQTVPAPAGRWR